MDAFFHQISIVENKFLKLKLFKNYIKKMFSAILIIAGIIANYSSKNQFKKWVKNFVSSDKDPKLVGTYCAVNDAIVKLC